MFASQDEPVISYTEYYQNIKKILIELRNAETLHEQAMSLGKLNKLDEAFLTAYSRKNQKIRKILFTRHGLCSRAHKNFGLAPNTSVENIALDAMQNTCIATQALFKNEKMNRIFVSPLVRARQTAAKLIPNDFVGAISIAPCLAENSENPSGKPIQSSADLLSHKGPKFSLSYSMYQDSNYFSELRVLSEQANLDIKAKSTNKLIKLEESINSVPELSDKAKIQQINALIDQAEGDIWFIGHGKNIRTYFNDRYDLDYSLDYCQTRKILHFEDKHGVKSEFVVPYVLIVNQETGLLRGAMLSETEAKLEFYSNPINELQQYILTRLEKHNNSSQHRAKLFTQAMKELAGIDYATKINAAEKVIAYLSGKPHKESLTDLEKTALADKNLGRIIKKYRVNLNDIALNVDSKTTNVQKF